MDSIISYIENYGHKSFDELAFCDVDSLILSQLSYLNFDNQFPETSGSDGIRLSQIKYHNSLFLGTFNKSGNEQLFANAVRSKRYKDIKLRFFVNEFEKESQKQFSAITFICDKFAYIAFRGTDSSIIGWKEDFNMSFMTSVPSQKSGVKYTNMVSKHIDSPLILGGHSKGGNIAIYSACFCERSVKDRIISVYDFDGPGFMNDVTLSKSYDEIKDRLIKIVPQSSLIGMLMQADHDYMIVKSKNIGGIMQHDPFSWRVTKNKFMLIPKLTSSSKYINAAINKWFVKLSGEERKNFIEAIFAMLSSTNAEKFDDIPKILKKNVISVLKNVASIDKATKNTVIKTIGLLIPALRDIIIQSKNS